MKDILDSQAVHNMAHTLRESVRVAKQDLFNAEALSGRRAELTLWAARELVRHTDGIVFGVLPGFPGHLHRLDTEQIVKHAGRQRRAGFRKINRSLHKLRVAVDTSTDERTRELASRAEARAHMRMARKILPP